MKKDKELLKKKNMHFVGIGGIGMSGIARILLDMDYNVSGSDLESSNITRKLEEAGGRIFRGHRAANIANDTEVLVYSSSISEDNPELQEARRRNITIAHRAEVLGELFNSKIGIAITGTHGKTTTTAMVAKILIDAGMDPTVIVGSILKDVKSNFIAGKSKYLIVEACEYCRSFLQINPTVVAITTIDDDHLDYYKDSEDIENAFSEFASRASEVVVGDINDIKISQLATRNPQLKIIDSSNFFDKNLKLRIPGEHNRKDASIALAIVDFVGISKDIALKSIKEFSGTWRRFEYKGETSKGSKVYDDYGHHPAEIKATIQGTREAFPDSKIIVIFQPHLFSRTKSLLSDFQKAFDGVDKTILLPIYPAREEFDPTIASDDIITASSKKIEMAKDFSDAEKKAFEFANKGDVILVMGAGDVYEVTNLLLSQK